MDHHFPNPGDQYYNYQPQTIEVMPELNSISTLIMDLGIPACVILASFWFIRFQSIEARKEREQFWAKDEEHDERLLQMVEKSSDAILQIKLSIEQNTAAMREMAAAWKR
tara:strand:- start:3191 stop:3520 length:330 start_codon:yes stop_codon:yes gene_type:complete